MTDDELKQRLDEMREKIARCINDYNVGVDSCMALLTIAERHMIAPVMQSELDVRISMYKEIIDCLHERYKAGILHR